MESGRNCGIIFAMCAMFANVIFFSDGLSDSLDVDECEGTRNTCSGRGKCRNTFGSFICQCLDGYTGQICNIDVDECMDRNVCSGHGRCTNNWGSFTCECFDGYTGKSCETVLQCKDLSAPRNGKISYKIGIEKRTKTYNSTVSMICDLGYNSFGNTLLRCNKFGEWDGTLGYCADVDECKGTTNACSGRGNCSNTFGSFICHCRDGYTGQICSTVIYCEELLQTNSSILSIDGGIEGNWTYNTTATIACDQGYALMGHKTVRCGNSSDWNASIGYCVAMESLESDYNVAGSVGAAVVAVLLVVVGAIICFLVYRRKRRPLDRTAETPPEELRRISEVISHLIQEQSTTHKVMYAKPIQMKERVSKASECKGDNA